MFVRLKTSDNRKYLKIVENYREGKKVKQRTLATLGRIDRLEGSRKIDSLINCLSKFADKVKVINITKDIISDSTKKIGADIIVGRIWKELGLTEVIRGLLKGRRYEFEVERAIYFTVLSRLFFPGSDRKALNRSRDYKVEGIEGLGLHHLYRAMAWLGDNKDRVEEGLFLRNRNLFTGLSLVFFDTTSIYFEGRGGESLGQYGYSKDRRSDERQMIVGAVIESSGRPISCPMWSGNTADVKVLIPVVEDLRERFGVTEVVIVADRGMMSRETEQRLQAMGIGYILGVKMAKDKVVKQDVLSRAGKYKEVRDNLKVKEVHVEGSRYIVCLNPDEAERDAFQRQVIIETLGEKLKEGQKALIGNRGYKKYLKVRKNSVEIDYDRIKEEERFDGKYVLKTNTTLSAEEVALRYKELWQVERIFRELKSVLETRPVYHKYDSTIKGHVFCSFLALVVMKELIGRLNFKVEWEEIRQDIESLSQTDIEIGDKRYAIRSKLQGHLGKIFRALRIAPPQTILEL